MRSPACRPRLAPPPYLRPRPSLLPVRPQAQSPPKCFSGSRLRPYSSDSALIPPNQTSGRVPAGVLLGLAAAPLAPGPAPVPPPPWAPPFSGPCHTSLRPGSPICSSGCGPCPRPLPASNPAPPARTRPSCPAPAAALLWPPAPLPPHVARPAAAGG